MRIAISTDGKNVSAHFGRCPEFTLVDIKDGETENVSTIKNPGHSPGNIPRFLKGKNSDVIVCGGMGVRAQGFFKDFGIKTIIGVTGNVNDTIQKIKDGTLQGGESLCKPGGGKGYGIEKDECDHED